MQDKADASYLQNMAKTNVTNVFSVSQVMESSAFGTADTNVALKITARTDINQYARPGIRLDCYGTGAAIIYFDTDAQLKIKIGEEVRAFQLV